MLLVQHKCLVPDAPLLRPPHSLPNLDAFVQQRFPRHDVFPAPDQLAPVAGFCGLGKVPFAEDLNAVVCDAFCFLGVVEEVLHCGAEVAEVAFYFDEVLVRTIATEQVVVVLDPLQFVRDDHRAAELAVFERAGVATTCDC